MTTKKENFNYLFKVVLVGDTNVGKTNMLSQLVSKKFLEGSKPTIGVEFGTKYYEFEDCKIKTQIWDTAGQERYHAIISAYYRGACGAIVVYDITDKASFKNATEIWLPNIKKSCNSDIPIMLVGNKSDLGKSRAVKMEIGRDGAMSNKCSFYETSACTGENIDKAFEEFVEKIYQKEKGKNSMKNKRYARQEHLKGEELQLVEKKKGGGCC
ncbi:YPT32 [Enterospora canceri]|uniref:YPT32 n=1 Tax=Enterospora canceri TaxID=1081671 RepID=A0A1Y1S664_9MICR|nr:YPT32 [Enterospora canceri]